MQQQSIERKAITCHNSWKHLHIQVSVLLSMIPYSHTYIATTFSPQEYIDKSGQIHYCFQLSCDTLGKEQVIDWTRHQTSKNH